jgi:hypothetical protein
MLPKKRTIRIFISSPGDVGEERIIVRRVIERISEDLPGGCVLIPVDWTDRRARTAFLATLTPQQAIERGLPAPDKCSIVVVILWSRIGTPLDPNTYRKPDGSGYLSGTEYEYEIAAARARVCSHPRVLIFRRTKAPFVALDDPLYEEKGRQWNLLKHFFFRFEKPDGPWSGSYESYVTPTDFEPLVEALLRKEIKGSQGILAEEPDAEELAAASQPPWQGSPFPGLRAFQPMDAPIFFGREREIEQLIAQLRGPDARFLAIVGASGSGKSSLVRAGLIPRLMENAIAGSSDWRWACFTPARASGDPFLALASSLVEADEGLPALDPAAMAATLLREPSNTSLVSNFALQKAPAAAELLLVVDQLEELFTLVAPELQEPLIEFIDHAVKSPRFRVVTTFRADFYHRCIEFPKLAQLLRAAFPLTAPDAVTLHTMIRRPAEYAGLEMEGDLAQRIMEDTGANPGALALMAYLLDELYRETIKSGSRALGFAAYESLGRVQGAIAHRAENIFAQLDREAQEALPLLAAELAQVDDRGAVSRQRAPLKIFAKHSPALRLIDELTRSRLLVQSGSEAQEPMVEVAHEALLHNWDRLDLLIRATLEDRRLLAQMRSAAIQWEQHGKSTEFLWTHERSVEMERMLARLHPSLNAIEQEFARPESAHLLDQVRRPETNHDDRARIGDRLDELNDARSGIGVMTGGSPRLDWVRVEIKPASSYAPSDSVSVMIGNLPVQVRPFYITRYPISYAQYFAFVEASDGFRDSRWWKGLEVTDHQRLNPGVQARRIRNHPAENVSWYDAVAACRWISARLGFEVRLPEEAEWQLAAGANRDNFVYPWGKLWRPGFANTWASGLNRTIACGMYPQGAAPCTALDMCGNVYEWTATPGYEPGKRMVRGGSWYHAPAEATVTARQNFFPYERQPYCGFRVACNSLPHR